MPHTHIYTYVYMYVYTYRYFLFPYATRSTYSLSPDMPHPFLPTHVTHVGDHFFVLFAETATSSHATHFEHMSRLSPTCHMPQFSPYITFPSLTHMSTASLFFCAETTATSSHRPYSPHMPHFRFSPYVIPFTPFFLCGKHSYQFSPAAAEIVAGVEQWQQAAEALSFPFGTAVAEPTATATAAPKKSDVRAIVKGGADIKARAHPCSATPCGGPPPAPSLTPP